MKIYKFGGASVKNASSVKNLLALMKKEQEARIIVISAMGKTTNALEEITELYFSGKEEEVKLKFKEIKKFHTQIYQDLNNNDYSADNTLSFLFDKLENKLTKKPSLNFDFEYDQIVSFGELFSTRIIYSFLKKNTIKCRWTDAREIIRTDNTYREANLNWETSKMSFDNKIGEINEHIITQGFIGSTPEGINTTLGREGSDYTAAILAVLSKAESVTIWKDVPGVMNADPKIFDFSERLDFISFQEAIELAFYGAKVIHPRTIKPLQNYNIPLFVKSFLKPESKGTVIKSSENTEKISPVYIVKDDQVLLSISPWDFSFIMEKHISHIYSVFHKYGAHVSISQNSAISYTVGVSCDKRKIPDLIKNLRNDFKVLYNEKLKLITIRHYNDSAINKMLNNKTPILEQKSRKTARFLIRN